jgi:hypothetical protein
MKHIRDEGICRGCGWRVTVERDARCHSRDGELCGPVEVDHPSVVRDRTWPDRWMVPRQSSFRL